MALASQSQMSPNWGRWPQHSQNDFTMMESQGFVPYDVRDVPPAEVQRPMAHQYVVGPAYSSAPMPGLAAPHCEHPHFSYVPYHSPPPSVQDAPSFKYEYMEQPPCERFPSSGTNGVLVDPSRSQHYSGLPIQPMPVRSASISSTVSTASNPCANSKTIIFNETINPADRVEFDTPVDRAMKAGQKFAEKEKAKTHLLTPVQSPNSEESTEAQSPSRHALPTTPGPAGRRSVKKYFCNGPNCGRGFVQKTHLDIHRRTHTGEKPYLCPKPNCGHSFTQRGNLKTHLRRHTGEKPFCCRLCGKTFAQRGNVRAHEETHKGLKPFVCRLDSCNKKFSQLGNMKTHQNHFHKRTVEKLIKMMELDDVPESHREIITYFLDHHKNSNKGIKGRGKARTVAARKPKHAGGRASGATPITPPFSQMSLQTQHHGVSNQQRTSVYSGGYDVYEQHPGHHSPHGMMYEGEPRQMAFDGHRLY